MIVERIAVKRPHPLRIAAYCRVSTLQESQDGSLASQQDFFKEYIAGSPSLLLTEIYADKQSGTTGNRKEFRRMMADAQQGKFDQILCKSLSRFSRNVVETLKCCEILETAGVNVIFLRENLDTANKTTLLLLRLMAVLAQGESQAISENIRKANHKRFLEGRYSPGSHACLGYQARSGRLVPDENAPAIRMIFQDFAAGKSCSHICQKLKALGIKSHRGKDITIQSLKYILSNETYTGDKALLKHQRLSPFDKHLTDKNLIYLKDDHEPIIDRELWNKAQERLARMKKNAPGS